VDGTEDVIYGTSLTFPAREASSSLERRPELLTQPRTPNQAKPYRRPDMAARNTTRGARFVARSGGSRSRTHPSPRSATPEALQRR
jgi:hypothetical protein